jgi:hypothetical protein
VTPRYWLKGVPWTFDNKQQGDRNVKVRLDKAVASPAWSAMFLEHRLHHLVSSRSDHCPILVFSDLVTRGPVSRPEGTRLLGSASPL